MYMIKDRLKRAKELLWKNLHEIIERKFSHANALPCNDSVHSDFPGISLGHVSCIWIETNDQLDGSTHFHIKGSAGVTESTATTKLERGHTWEFFRLDAWHGNIFLLIMIIHQTIKPNRTVSTSREHLRKPDSLRLLVTKGVFRELKMKLGRPFKPYPVTSSDAGKSRTSLTW